MHLAICLSPNLFQKDTYQEEVFKELRRILIHTKKRAYIIYDENEYIKNKYIKNIRDTNNDDYIKHVDILLNDIENNYGNQILKIGKNLENFYIDSSIEDENFKFLKFYNKIIKNLKIIKNNSDSKNNFFFILCSHQSNQDKKIDYLYKYIVGDNFENSRLFLKKEEFSESIDIRNKSVNKVINNYVIPIIWNSNTINFYVLDIAYVADTNRKIENHNRFYNHIKKVLLNIIKFNEYENNLTINIITGGKNINNQAEIEIDKNIIQKLQRNFPKIKFFLIFHNKPNKIVNIHPRAIMANNNVIAYERIPDEKFKKNEEYAEKFNDISLKNSYLSVAKDLLTK